MIKLSQNKKIAISAIALFFVSFSVILFFLSNNENRLYNDGHVDVLASGQDENGENIEDIYRHYLQDQDAIMFVTNAEGEIQYPSEKFCELLSSDCEDLYSTRFFDYINSKDLPEVVYNHTKLIQNGEPLEGLGPYRMIKKNEEILVLISAYPVLDKDKKVVEIVFSARDLTEQVEELNQNEVENEEKSNNYDWIDDLYPKIKEMKNEHEIKMLVDKISYNK